MLEREFKLVPPKDFSLINFSGPLPEGWRFGDWQQSLQESVYWDTVDLALTRAGLSLRYREGEGWLVKLPRSWRGEFVGRTEVVVAGEPERVPGKVMELLRAHIRFERMLPVLRLEATRTKRTIEDADGTVRALLVLDTVAAAEGSGEHFRELELELMPEMKEEKATALLLHLESLGVQRSDGIAKHVRALGARALVPLPWVIDQVKSGGTLAELVASALSRSVQQLLHHDPRVFVGDDAEDVHQARVAVRRLRSDLQTFDVVLGKMPIAQLHDDLQPLAQALGALRDLDVLMGRLQGHLDTLPTGLRDHADELQRRIERERERAREVLLELRSGAVFAVTLERLLREVPLLLHIPKLQQPAEDAVGKVLERAWQPLREMVRRLPKQPRDNQLHRVRILAKRCRYAVEALTPLLPASASDFAHEVARLQTALGDYHDAVVAQRYWERLARDGHKGMKALLEELRKRDHAQESVLRVRWREQWGTLEGHPFLAEGAL